MKNVIGALLGLCVGNIVLLFLGNGEKEWQVIRERPSGIILNVSFIDDNTIKVKAEYDTTKVFIK